MRHLRPLVLCALLWTPAAGKVVKTGQEFKAIPYYAWANRGAGQMMVWIPNSEASATPAGSARQPVP